jgi:hypothetical protein
VFIVHYRREAPTTSTIALTLGVDSPNPVTKVFAGLTTDPDATFGCNVALVDVKSRMIGEHFGTRTTEAADQRLSLQKER